MGEPCRRAQLREGDAIPSGSGGLHGSVRRRRYGFHRPTAHFGQYRQILFPALTHCRNIACSPARQALRSHRFVGHRGRPHAAGRRDPTFTRRRPLPAQKGFRGAQVDVPPRQLAAGWHRGQIYRRIHTTSLESGVPLVRPETLDPPIEARARLPGIQDDRGQPAIAAGQDRFQPAESRIVPLQPHFAGAKVLPQHPHLAGQRLGGIHARPLKRRVGLGDERCHAQIDLKFAPAAAVIRLGTDRRHDPVSQLGDTGHVRV